MDNRNDTIFIFFSHTHKYVKNYYYYVLCISFSEIKSWNFSFRSLENKNHLVCLVVFLCSLGNTKSWNGVALLSTMVSKLNTSPCLETIFSLKFHSESFIFTNAILWRTNAWKIDSRARNNGKLSQLHHFD